MLFRRIRWRKFPLVHYARGTSITSEKLQRDPNHSSERLQGPEKAWVIGAISFHPKISKCVTSLQLCDCKSYVMSTASFRGVRSSGLLNILPCSSVFLCLWRPHFPGNAFSTYATILVCPPPTQASQFVCRRRLSMIFGKVSLKTVCLLLFLWLRREGDWFTNRNSELKSKYVWSRET